MSPCLMMGDFGHLRLVLEGAVGYVIFQSALEFGWKLAWCRGHLKLHCQVTFRDTQGHKA